MRISLVVFGFFCCYVLSPSSVWAQRSVDFVYYHDKEADADQFLGSVQVSLLQTRSGKADYNFSQVANPITLEVEAGTSGEIHVVFENIEWKKNKHKDNEIVINPGNLSNLPYGLGKPSQGIRVDGKNNSRGVLKFPIISNGFGYWRLPFDVIAKNGRVTKNAATIRIGQIRIRYPEAAWNIARSKNTCDDVDVFLKDYPNSQYDVQAKNLKSKLCPSTTSSSSNSSSNSAEAAAWNACKANKNSDQKKVCLEGFLSSSTYSNRALSLLTDLEEEVWKRLLKDNRCTQYKAYLKVWAKGEFTGYYVSDAEFKIAGNNCKPDETRPPIIDQGPGPEERAWIACQEAQGDSAGIPCMYYLETYPEGIYREEAIQKLPAISVSSFTRSKSIFSGVINYALAPIKLVKVVRDGIDSGEGEILEGEDGTWRYLESILTASFEGGNRLKVVAGEKKVFKLTVSDATERTTTFKIDATREPLEIIAFDGSNPDSITFKLKGGQAPYVMQILSQGSEKVEYEIDQLNPTGGIAKVDIADDKGKRLDGTFMVRFRDKRRNEYKDAELIDLEGEKGYGWLILLVVEMALLVWLYFIFSRRKTAYS